MQRRTSHTLAAEVCDVLLMFEGFNERADQVVVRAQALGGTLRIESVLDPGLGSSADDHRRVLAMVRYLSA